MNTLRFYLLILFLPQFIRAQDLRMIGTNLYDFSKAAPIIAVVSRIYPQSITIKTPGQTYYKFASPDWAMQWNPGRQPKGWGIYRVMTDTEKTYEANQLAALQQIMPLVAQARAIANLPVDQQAGAFHRAGPAVQEFLHPTTPTLCFQVLHPPITAVGQTISLSAVALSTPGFLDHGTPYMGDLSQFKHIYRVLPGRIIRAAVQTSTNTPAPIPRA